MGRGRRLIPGEADLEAGRYAAEPRASSEHGFSLMEVIVATVIATIAILGLSFTFGNGQGLIRRFELARAGLASAQQRMEALTVAGVADTSLGIGTHGSSFVLDGDVLGLQRWEVAYVDDPADGLGASDSDSDPEDLKAVTVEVIWQTGSLSDTVRLHRVFVAK